MTFFIEGMIAFNYEDISGSNDFAACLEWRWASTNGPSTFEEELIFWAVLVMGVTGGYRYFSMSYWQPLIPLWYANIFASLAYAMARLN